MFVTSLIPAFNYNNKLQHFSLQNNKVKSERSEKKIILIISPLYSDTVMEISLIKE